MASQRYIFEEEAVRLFLDIESSGIFDALPSAIRKAMDLHRSIDTDFKPAWKDTTSILQPGSDPHRLDIAGITGFANLRQLRRRARLPITRVGSVHRDGAPRQGSLREPIDPAVRSDQPIALMTDYCSRPLPESRTVDDNRIDFAELISNGIDTRSAITCFLGKVARNVAQRYRDNDDFMTQVITQISIPCELLLLDWAIHETPSAVSRPR